MKTKISAWVLGVLLLGAAPVFATSVSINFGTPNTISGDTATYNVGSSVVTANGYACLDNTLASCSTAGIALATKNGGPSETGLGILSFTPSAGDNEIESNQFIQFDFSQLAHFGITSMTFQIGSVQNNEGFRLFESNVSGVAGASPVLTLTGNGSNNPNSVATVTVSVNFATNRYIDISALNSTAASNDVLAGGASGTGGATPEPGTLALFGAGLLLAGFAMRRRFGDQSA